MSPGNKRSLLVLTARDPAPAETIALFAALPLAVKQVSNAAESLAAIALTRPFVVAARLTELRTLRSLAALPSRPPVLLLATVDDIDNAADLCTAGLADDYLVIEHLADDRGRLGRTIDQLIECRQLMSKAHRGAEFMAELSQAFMRFDFELQQELSRQVPAGRGMRLLSTMRATHHRLKSRISDAPVLIVDDDPDYRALLRTLVGVLRHPVVDVSDAGDALDWLASHEPSLVVLDYQMPGQDGVSFLEWMRQSPRLQPVPVMMVSGHRRPDTSERARRLGVTDFIVKPCDPPTILQKIAAYL